MAVVLHMHMYIQSLLGGGGSAQLGLYRIESVLLDVGGRFYVNIIRAVWMLRRGAREQTVFKAKRNEGSPQQYCSPVGAGPPP